MRRTLTALLATALATLALGAAAVASPGAPTVELNVTPQDPKAGEAVMLEAYVHYGTKPYIGAQVEFIVAGPSVKTALHGKPGQPGHYRAQFVPQSGGDFEIFTKVDGQMVSSKPYHLQVSSSATAFSSEWMPLAAGVGALALLAALGILGIRRFRFARTATATH